jgi:hypothetical protein
MNKTLEKTAPLYLFLSGAGRLVACPQLLVVGTLVGPTKFTQPHSGKSRNTKEFHKLALQCFDGKYPFSGLELESGEGDHVLRIAERLKALYFFSCLSRMDQIYGCMKMDGPELG